jgi:hypothetical protein
MQHATRVRADGFFAAWTLPMISSDGDRQSCHRPARGRTAGWTAAVCIFVAPSLTGCTMSDGYGTLVVDPARYSAYHCKDLIAQRNSLISREQELRGLIEKASEGPGGSAIAAMAYRTDYETVLSDEKLLQRTVAEKKCELTPTYQSDQSVR